MCLYNIETLNVTKNVEEFQEKIIDNALDNNRSGAIAPNMLTRSQVARISADKLSPRQAKFTHQDPFYCLQSQIENCLIKYNP